MGTGSGKRPVIALERKTKAGEGGNESVLFLPELNATCCVFSFFGCAGRREPSLRPLLWPAGGCWPPGSKERGLWGGGAGAGGLSRPSRQHRLGPPRDRPALGVPETGGSG